MSLFQEYGSSTPSRVRSLQASGLAIESIRNGPSHLLCIFPYCLLFGIRRRTRLPSLISRGLTFLLRHLRVSSWYLPRLIARLCFDGFDRVDCWLDVFVRCFSPIGPMAKFFWCHCLFAIEEVEGSEFYCP